MPAGILHYHCEREVSGKTAAPSRLPRAQQHGTIAVTTVRTGPSPTTSFPSPRTITSANLNPRRNIGDRHSAVRGLPSRNSQIDAHEA